MQAILQPNIRPSFVLTFILLALACLAPSASQAQSPYFSAITNLNPAGYWPMHEIEAPAPGDTETNYGTLGLLGTGYYPDWVSNSKGILRGFPGAITGDGDTAVHFTKIITSGAGTAGTFTNELYVPHTSPLSTLNPPFSVECWYYPTNTSSQCVWAQFGFAGLNAGTIGLGAGEYDGIQFVYNGSFTVYGEDNAGQTAVTASPSEPVNNWFHLVVTCDANTNINLYVNGNAVGSTGVSVGKYSPDYWTPLTIGGGRGGTRSASGTLDEFAVYTNVITDISTHYNDGVSGGPGAYFHDVTNDNAVIYLRLDAPAYAAPSSGTWPALVNYGQINGVADGNGVYSPGTMPGVATIPITNPNGVVFAGVPASLAQLSGVSSYADAGFAAAYNPTGPTPFSVTALFRGNPCDGRYQDIVGHSDNSWRIGINTNGTLQCQLGTNSSSVVNSPGVYNDGNWHQVVEVYSPASAAAVPGTNALFVDGSLVAVSTAVSTNGISPGTNLDVMIGSDPQYTNNPVGVGRQFAGQVCEVAVFTNALTAAQVQALYSAGGVAPFVATQPANSGIVNGGPGSFANFSAKLNGSVTLASQWYFNSSSNYNGAPVNGAQYLNAATAQMTITNLVSGNTGYYYVVTTNNYGSVTSAIVSLTVDVAPAIASQSPLPYTNPFTLYTGANPIFSVTASGANPIYYQWYTNGVLDSSATGSVMQLAAVQPGNLAAYCVATNFVGSTTGAVWTATVIMDPTNLTGGLAPYPQAVLALNPVGYWRLNEGPEQGGGDDGLIAYDYAGGNNGLYTNAVIGNAGYDPDTDPGGGSAEFGIASFTDGDVYGISNVNFGAPTNINAAFTVEAWVNGYQQTTNCGIVTLGYGGGQQFTLDTGSIPTPGTHDFRFMIHTAAGASSAVNSTVTPNFNDWYHLVGVCDEANSNLTFYINGAPVGSAAVAPGSGLLPTSRLLTIGAASATSNSDNNLQFVGLISDVAVYNYALSANQVLNQYISSGNVSPFFIQAPPTNVTLAGGTALTLPVLAAGTAPLSYEWQEINSNTVVATGSSNGIPLNASLTVSNVPGGWNGDQLELTVSSSYGVTNFFVSLNVETNPPQITTDLPANVTIVSGSAYTYAIGVSGAAPYSYQWYSDGTPIAGQTNATYAFTAGLPGSTSYDVVIGNQFGSVTSSISIFTSLPIQIIQDLPPAVTIVVSNTYLYSVGVNGALPLYYQWYQNGTQVAGQTNAVYPLVAGSPGSATYSVIITNSYGAATSSISALTIVTQLTNAYAASLRQLNPAGYWPMHEVEAAAAGDTETNYGSLGLLGTGYYPDWVAANAHAIQRGVPGAIAGDSDTAVHFTQLINTGSGSSGTFTNEIYVPHTSPLSTLIPPFSVECWYYPTNTPSQAIWAQFGFAGLNAGAQGSGAGAYDGIQFVYNGGFTVYGEDNAAQYATASSASEPVNNWYHLVVTCDANTNISLYVNGSQAGSTVAAAGEYAPDYWTPLTIGGGRGGTRSCPGTIDEFAIYTNVITDISTHYNDGIGGGAGAYFSDVTNDNPVIYLRMDAPAAYAPSMADAWPVLINYGSVANPGVYSPGTMPGLLAGPFLTNDNSYPGLSSTNVAQFSGVSSYADAGFATAYNPLGATPFSVTAMFRGNPSDGRVQAIVGHSDNSWRILMNANGTLQCQLGTNAASQVNSTGVFNDGNWHQVTEVYSPGATAATAGSNLLYVDGTLAASAAAVSTNGIEPGTNLDVLIGGDPQYTNNPAGVGRQFSGQVCEVAIFNNALTFTQVQELYSVATGTVLVNQNPTNIISSVTGNELTLSWPADHAGWELQAQTNSLVTGLGANWVAVPGSTATDQMVIPISPTSGCVFYRLVYPPQ